MTTREDQPYPFISAAFPEASRATGLSETVLREAVKTGELVAHYYGSKPVLRAADLDDYVRSLPTSRTRR